MRRRQQLDAFDGWYKGFGQYAELKIPGEEMSFVVDQKMIDQGVLWIMFLSLLLVGIPALWKLLNAWARTYQQRTNSLDVERRQREEKRDAERSMMMNQLFTLTKEVTAQSATQTEVMRSASIHIERGNITHDRFMDLVGRLIEKIDTEGKAVSQRLEIMHGELSQVLQLQQLDATLSQKEHDRVGQLRSQPLTKKKNQAHTQPKGKAA